MADILVHNAIKEVSKKLSLNATLGISEAEIKTAVAAAVISSNAISSAFTNVLDVCSLSCMNLISACCSNFIGSGNTGYVGSSPWHTLDTHNLLVYTIFDKIMKLPEMATIAKKYNIFDSNTIKMDIRQYIETYALEVINASSQAVKNNWLGNDTANKLKVCSSNYNAGQGATCTWTVPAGVTKAKFQLWGAGAGTNPGCCCGGASFGPNGAYAELAVNVTAGQQYVLCAGCSCAINCCSTYWPGYACMSGVTGPAICCLKADGGNNCIQYIFYNMRPYLGAGGACCKFQNFYCTSGGPCFCSYGEYCFVGCDTCGVVAVYPDCVDRTYCACGTTTAQRCAGGYRPIHGGGCLDTSNYGYHTRPPTLDADTCKTFTGGCKCHTFTSENCAGGLLGDGWCRHPGMGGASTHVMGGNNTHWGGKGAGGMVQVTWE